MAITRISNTPALAMCNAAVQSLDDGPAAGVLKLYTGSMPTDVDAPATGTLLAELTLSDPAFAAAVDTNPGAAATANAISPDLSANATGAAGYFRAETSNGLGRIQGDVGLVGSGAALELNTVTIAAGQQVNVNSWVYRQPEG